jgi:pimeloyl-ACP methyl ester carboxylesterase
MMAANDQKRRGRAMPQLHIPDVGELNYEVEGKGAPAFALMHGWCSNLRHWDRQAEFFAPRHTIVRADRRGMGKSACKRATRPADHADDLARVLDAAGVEKAIVVGHAGGGAGAVDFAARYRDRTLALIGVDTSAAPASTEGSDAYRWMKAFADDIRDIPGEFERRYRGFFGPKADPDLVNAVVRSALATPIDVASAELMGLAATDTAARGREVTAPVLWVTAQPADYAHLRSVFADFTPAVAVGSGHYLQLEVPHQLNAMIQTFVQQRLL